MEAKHEANGAPKDAPDEEPVGQIGAEPVCERCGSVDVVVDAWAAWNPVTGLWELGQLFDQAFCAQCDSETALVWRRRMEDCAETVRRLNDALRIGESTDGLVVVTAGIQALGSAFLAEVTRAVRRFDAFTEGNDPHGEHDFGAIDVEGERVFWKIDSYDLTMTAHSPDPSDPDVTRRVLTIMLAAEY